MRQPFSDEYAIHFASRMVSLCALVSGWMTGQVPDRLDYKVLAPLGPGGVRSYLAQIRRKLDEIEKEFCP